jgi:hypothetical protein
VKEQTHEYDDIYDDISEITKIAFIFHLNLRKGNVGLFVVGNRALLAADEAGEDVDCCWGVAICVVCEV